MGKVETATSSGKEEEFSSRDVETNGLSEKLLDRIYRRLDARIIPALWCLYFLTSFGSSAYGNTLTMNAEVNHSLRGTLGLTAHDTSVASALYYVGYIIFDVPMNILMTRLSPQIWLSRVVMSVGIVYLCYSALNNARGIMAIRFMSGFCGAGTWPGMSYYISLWYPNHRSAKRIGYYFTAAQLSASAAGLVAAGFQKMDMTRGLEGWKWLYIIYGSITVTVGISLIWWLPDRPQHMLESRSWYSKYDFARFLPKSTPPLNERDTELHRMDMTRHYRKLTWGWKDVAKIFYDVRIWPLVLMYFGIAGTGFGLAVFGTTIIRANNPGLSSINVSLLYAPIWLFDLSAILLVTPFADRFKRFRPIIFSCSVTIIIVGLFVTTYTRGWNSYGGLLISGFGLGPTYPICMSWAAEIFVKSHGDVGAAVSAAVVSGLGNLGSVTATYALYTGWPLDVPRRYQYSNMMLVLMLGVSIVSCFVCWLIQDYGTEKFQRQMAEEIERETGNHESSSF